MAIQKGAFKLNTFLEKRGFKRIAGGLLDYNGTWQKGNIKVRRYKIVGVPYVTIYKNNIGDKDFCLGGENKAEQVQNFKQEIENLAI